jgi:hypothetical protein
MAVGCQFTFSTGDWELAPQAKGPDGLARPEIKATPGELPNQKIEGRQQCVNL